MPPLKKKRSDIKVCIVSCFSKSVDELLADIKGEKLTSYTVTNVDYSMENVMLDSPKASGKEPWLIGHQNSHAQYIFTLTPYILYLHYFLPFVVYM